jgi:hypothetical protein
LYIGPGLGAGTVTAIFGVLISFFLSLIAIFWYPLKRFFRYIKSKYKNQ